MSSFSFPDHVIEVKEVLNTVLENNVLMVPIAMKVISIFIMIVMVLIIVNSNDCEACSK